MTFPGIDYSTNTYPRLTFSNVTFYKKRDKPPCYFCPSLVVRTNKKTSIDFLDSTIEFEP